MEIFEAPFVDALTELADRVTICRLAEIEAAENGLSPSFRGNLALARMLAEEELRIHIARTDVAPW